VHFRAIGRVERHEAMVRRVGRTEARMRRLALRASRLTSMIAHLVWFRRAIPKIGPLQQSRSFRLI
jgi:hypothetical protein